MAREFAGPGGHRARPKGAPGVPSSRAWTRFLAIVLALCACLAAPPSQAAMFTVNSTADAHDANAGDGICETAAGNHVCTLRAAIEEANELAGADTIVLQPNVTYTLTMTSTLDTLTSDLNVIDSVTITGSGPDSTIIDGNGAVTGHRVFELFQCIDNAMACSKGNVSVTMSGLTIKNGFATNIAGGIYNTAILTLDNVAVTDNAANGLNDWGGGIFSAGPLTMTNCLLANNQTGAHNAYGGGMYSQGTLTIIDSTISGNSTYSGPSSPGEGGGLFLIGSPTTIRNSTISGNRAAVGGGIYHGGYPVVLINSTISGNTSDGNGGGLHNASGTTGLYNVTVTQNIANNDAAGFSYGGGLSNATGTVTVINSVIAGNEVVIPTLPFPTLDFDECVGIISNQGYSILQYVDTNNCTVVGAYSTGDPQLGELQFNGGPTQTHAISPGSAAIDAGNPAGCTDDLGATITTDQRGIHRPYGSACDIGAFEYADIIFRNGFEPPI
jgi:CSLREA domain-containing protein